MRCHLLFFLLVVREPLREPLDEVRLSGRELFLLPAEAAAKHVVGQAAQAPAALCNGRNMIRQEAQSGAYFCSSRMRVLLGGLTALHFRPGSLQYHLSPVASRWPGQPKIDPSLRGLALFVFSRLSAGCFQRS